LLALSAQSDSSGQFEHNDVGLHLPALNLQHRLDPFAPLISRMVFLP
jgi:hypothetical protein